MVVRTIQRCWGIGPPQLQRIVRIARVLVPYLLRMAKKMFLEVSLSSNEVQTYFYVYKWEPLIEPTADGDTLTHNSSSNQLYIRPLRYPSFHHHLNNTC